MITCLLQGMESEKRIDILLRLAKFTSEPVIEALKLHLVKGYAEAMAYNTVGVPQQNFHRALKRLNELYAIAEEYTEIGT